MVKMWVRAHTVLCVIALMVGTMAGPRDRKLAGEEWPYYGGDPGATKYSTLDQITAANVKDLRVAWRHPGIPPDAAKAYPEILKELPGRERHLFFENSSNESRNNFQSTPLMVGGVMYAVNLIGLVEAIDPLTGKALWVQEPLLQGLAGYADRQKIRGLGYWREGTDARTFNVRGRYLFALDAKTGK